MKRALDLLLVLVSAPLWLPLAALVALVVLAIDGRPVLFTQVRAGKGGRTFRMFKFRSMRPGEGTDAVRITRLGAVLRRTSLDELPELWNVLRGEMSLVGPRPLPAAYLPRYTAAQNRRHEVLPGVTGWAQVNGRNALDWETRFRYDLEYVARRSTAFDLKILCMTVVRVLTAAGVSHPGEATMEEFKGVCR